MSTAATAGVNQPAGAPPPPPQPPPPPPGLPPHLTAYLSSPAVTSFLASLAPHFPSYTADELATLFATLLAARYRHSPHCTSQLQWTHKYAPASVNELWSHGPQTATLRHYTHSFTDASATAAMPSLLLVGPSSSSKTAAAYAIASTLQSAVIEVHAGMARSGRDVQALCGEATQSHRLQGDRKDVWAVVREERWRSWEKSQQNNTDREEHREAEEQPLDQHTQQQTSSAQRARRGKQANTKPNTKQQPCRPRKQQQSADSDVSEVEAAVSDAELPDRLVIRLKLRSNNRARLVSCPVAPLSPPPLQSTLAGKRKGRMSGQKSGTIAAFFTHSAIAAEKEQAEEEDEVVIERTEGVVVDSVIGSRPKSEKGKKRGRQRSKAIGDFFSATPAINRRRELEESKEEAAVQRNEQTDVSSEKKRRKGKRRAGGIGSFFTAAVNEVDDEIEETKEEPTAATRKRAIDKRDSEEEDAAMEQEEEVRTELTVSAPMQTQEQREREEKDDSRRKVQQGIGSFFGGKAEVIVLNDTTNGKRKGRKGKKAAAAIDLTSPPTSARNSAPTPPSPPPTLASSASASASTVLPSSSLILFEDVDLVFPTDVHFHRTLRQLVLHAKRPLLLTAQCVPSWVDEVSDDKLRIVQMARMGHQECVLHALLICAVETGVDDSSDGRSKGWSCTDVARLCCWWQYDVRRVLMTLQVLVAVRDTHTFSSDTPVDATLLPPSTTTALLSPPPSVLSLSSLLLSVVGLSSVSSPLLSTFSTLHASSFALLCSSSSSIDVTHLNWPSAVQRRALNVMQRLPLSEAAVTASVEEIVSLADVSADSVRVVVVGQKYYTDASVLEELPAPEVKQPAQVTAPVELSETMQQAMQPTADNPLHMSQRDDEAEFGSIRRVNGKRTVIAEDDEEDAHVELTDNDSDRLDSDVILVDPPPLPPVDSQPQQDAFMLHVRRLACQQLKEREQQHRLAFAASSVPSLAEQLACRFLQSVASLSSLLADCNILSCVRLLPLSSTVPSSLLYQRHPSLPPQYIDVNVPYSGSSYRCAEWWLTGEKDGLRGEMDEERRDEQPMCEEMFDELTAEIEAMALNDMRRAVEQLEAELDSASAAELTIRRVGAVPPPRRTPLGRQSVPIEVVVSADALPVNYVSFTVAPPFPQSNEPVTVAPSHSAAVLPASTSSTDSPFLLELAPPLPPTISSPAARLSTIHASRALFSSLRCKLHAPSSRTWLTDIYPFLCQMGRLEGQREDERRVEEQQAREERDRLAEVRQVRRQAEREARQLTRTERKRARKEKRKRKQLQRHSTPTISSSSSASGASDSSSDDSSSSHWSASSDDVSDGSSERVMDFFTPRASVARRSRRRHLSSRRVAAGAVSGGMVAREELHVCGGLNAEVYEEVMGALRLPRWRDWTDE